MTDAGCFSLPVVLTHIWLGVHSAAHTKCWKMDNCIETGAQMALRHAEANRQTQKLRANRFFF